MLLLDHHHIDLNLGIGRAWEELVLFRREEASDWRGAVGRSGGRGVGVEPCVREGGEVGGEEEGAFGGRGAVFLFEDGGELGS